jgi:N-6 DNA Methylase
MTEMKKLIDQTVQALVELGYSVDSQTWMSRGNKGRVNIFGWGAGTQGNIVPLVAVEVLEAVTPENIELALQQLSSAQTMMDTRNSFIFNGLTWWRVSEDFRSVEEGPQPNPVKALTKKITDPIAIGPMIKPELWKAMDATRGQLSIQEGIISAIRTILDSSTNLGDAIALSGNATMPLDRQAFVKALQQILMQMSGKDAQFGTPTEVVDFLFNLVGSLPKVKTFYDPFAGSGSTAREAWIRFGLTSDEQIQITGREINNSVVELADVLNSASKSHVTMELGNSFMLPSILADLVVTVPPLGMRLNEPIETPFGSTKNGDIAAIALAVSSLKPNGVAAMISPPGWTWSKEGQALRDWLSQNYHVIALLGLPPVLNKVTAISPVALVVRNSAPGTTVVGTLKEDWLTQSSDDQELKRAVNELLRGSSE